MQELGPYRLLAELGRGPAGVVFRAHDPWLERDVAVRVLSGQPSAGLEGLREEARRLARLRHPAVPQVLAVGETAGVAWVATDLVEGRPLVGPGQEPLRPEHAARIVRELARALAQAHALGLVHGDLRAERVVLEPDGSPVMCQLGAAQLLGWVSTRVSLEGELLGPVGDLAPEQLSGAGARATSWTDVHALGNLLARLIGGRPLFGGPGAPQLVVVDQVLNQAPDLSHVAARAAPLARVCARCLAKRPEDRPDAASVAAALEEWLEPARGPTGGAVRQLAWASAGGLLLALAPGFLWARTAQRAAPDAPAVESSATRAGPSAPALPAPATVEEAWRRAALAVERGELDAAWTTIEQGRALGEDRRLTALGVEVRLELGHDAEALLGEAEAALARWPDDLWLRAASQYLRAGLGSSPLDEVRRLSEAEATGAPPLARALACLHLAEATRLSDGARAWELTQRGLQAAPGLVGLRLEVARLREDQGDLTGAADALEAARAAGPRAPAAVCAWSAFQRRHGDARAALTLVESELGRDPTQPSLLAERALLCASLGEWKAVYECADRLDATRPRGAPPDAERGMRTALALAGLSSGAAADARRVEAELTQVLARDPGEPGLLWARSRARQALGDLNGAAADLRAALSGYAPQHPQAQRLREELERLERRR